MKIPAKLCVECGKPIVGRYFNARICGAACVKERARKKGRELYLDRDKERERARKREYYWKNKNKINKRHNLWKKDNPDKCNAYSKAWRDRNIEKVKIMSRRRHRREEIAYQVLKQMGVVIDPETLEVTYATNS